MLRCRRGFWTGLRKGELCGLLKTDVDLPNRILFVGRSYDSDTTKGGHADAIRCSPSAYVFPAPDGSMRSEDSTPQRVLRAALIRAGLTEGWEHVCRRCKANGAPRVERYPDSTLRRCDACGMKLWPRAIPRQMRFHDLRHAVGTLLLRAKVDAHRVQRILRHASINTTLGTYGHLDVEDLRDAINALPAGPAVPAIEPELSPHGAPVVRNSAPATTKAESAEISSTNPAFLPHDPAGIRTRVCAVRGGMDVSDGLSPLPIPSEPFRKSGAGGNGPTRCHAVRREVWSAGGPAWSTGALAVGLSAAARKARRMRARWGARPPASRRSSTVK